MKKIFAVILALVMMLALCACGTSGTETDVPADNSPNSNPNSDDSNNSNDSNNESQEPADIINADGMSLTKIGTVPRGVQFVSGGIVCKWENEKVQILNQNGVAFNTVWYDKIDSIISNGICVVSNNVANGKKLLGIVDSVAEKELVPCEASEVVKLSERFLLLGYETAAATKEDYFGFYYVNSEMIYYKGYGKILDLEKGQFISGLEINTTKRDVSAVGNVIVIEKEYPSYDVYVADGKKIGSYDYLYTYTESDVLLQSTTEGVCVYDKDMKLVSTLVTADAMETYKPVEGSNEMLLHEYSKDSKRTYCVTDLFGKALTADYTRIVTVFPDGFLHVSEDGNSRMVNFKGDVIVPAFDSIQYAEPGYFSARVQNEGLYAYDKNGTKINEVAMPDCSNGLVFKSNDKKVLVLNTGELLTVQGYIKAQLGSLFLAESTLYDAITGQAVLTDVDDCVATGDSLYVFDSDANCYTRYVAEFKS